MKKYVKQWVKEEKQIIKLLFQKGFMDRNFPAITELYWGYYRHGKRQRKRYPKKYKFHDYLPEVHHWSRDYWGECDEHAVVPEMIEGLHWTNLVVGSEDYAKNGGWGESLFVYKGRKWFIKYLKSLPTVNRSSKINRVLIRNRDY
ncbi:hypothetical protein [Pedobacter africanus]|uniref:Uncharacterized protein n=1 Tax=Pedobacter africanus TaxID=151894 RepID=A0A1W1ZC94_9SPHI|nr:hypothetical protein [Pedobacter africanus]SMC46035.1 hypothetical protein SAMN04488524_0590 [Pedobacter africanus]